MTTEQLKQREQELTDAGYRKSRNTSSTNDYSWFKTIRDPNDPEDWLYMIEWRVWSWVKYIDRDPNLAKNPYSMELCVLVCLPNGDTVRMRYPDGLTIEQAESLAKDFYDFIYSRYKSERESAKSQQN